MVMDQNVLLVRIVGFVSVVKIANFMVVVARNIKAELDQSINIK